MHNNQPKKLAKTHAHVAMTQLNVKQGIKKFGEKGNEVFIKELNQLHEREALLPLKKEDMSHEQQKRELLYLMFLKGKRDSTIKTRGCTDGRSHREYTAKSDTSSPTVSLQAVMMSLPLMQRETGM